MKKITALLLLSMIVFLSGCAGNLDSTIEIVNDCIHIEKSISANQISDLIVFENSNNAHDAAIRLINSNGMKTLALKDLVINNFEKNHREYVFAEGWFTNYWVNPDRGKIAYEATSIGADDTVFSYLGFIDSNLDWKTLQIEIDNVSDGKVVKGWLSNSMLLERDYRQVDKLTLLGLDVTNGEEKEIYPTFSQIYDEMYFSGFHDVIQRDGTVKVQTSEVTYLLNPVVWYEHIYNSLRTRVFLYVSNSNGMNLVMWDNQKNRVIWNEKIIGSPPFVSPQWSPDGREIVYIKDNQMFIVSAAGVKSKYNIPAQLSSNSLFSWSPNGKYIAFWLENSTRQNSESEVNLAVLDITKNIIVNYCIESDDSEIIWSPNSRQLLASIKRKMQKNQYVLLDFSKNQAFALPEEWGTVIGWIK